MDCHDVRLLLAFERRSGDALDPTERAALQQHLDACLDCAALARSDQAVDAALGSAMRAVAVPASARARVLTRLRATPPRRWPRVVAAAAAVVLVVVGASLAWTLRSKPQVDMAIVQDIVGARPGMSAGDVEQWYHEHGIDMAAWDQLDNRHLWTFDIVELQGRRVPKLIYFNSDRAAIAEVIVLSTRQFDTTALNGGIPGLSRKVFVQREPNPEYVYLIDTRDETLDAFLKGKAY